MRLVDEYIETGRSLPDDPGELAGICRISTEEFLSKVFPVLFHSGKFFKKRNGKWIQETCEEVLGDRSDSHKKFSAAGKKGARKRWNGLEGENTDSHDVENPAKSKAVDSQAIKTDGLKMAERERDRKKEGKSLNPTLPPESHKLLLNPRMGSKYQSPGSGGGDGCLIPQRLRDLLPILATGFDANEICNDYAEHIRKNGLPRNLDKAFPAWVNGWVKRRSR